MTESTAEHAKGNTPTDIVSFDSVLGNLVNEVENAMRTWSTSPWMPSLFDYNGLRLPLCEITDLGNRYELRAEVPGMSKENVKVKAQSYCVEVSAKKSKRIKEKNKGRIYTERSDSSFYRQVPVPEEIVPKKLKFQVKNGILIVELPKKIANRTKSRQRK